MTRFRTLILFVIPLAALVSLGGCARTYKNSFLEQAANQGWTKEQQHAALAYSYRLKFLKENTDGGYDVVYAVMPNKLVLEIIAKRLEDLNQVLNYNNKGWARYIEEFKLREDFEREESVLKAVYARLKLLENHNDFRDYVGDRSGHKSSRMDRAYDVSKIFVEDVYNAYPFNSTQIDEARKNGTLKEVERFIWYSKRTLGVKLPDPNDPDDSNKFVWVPVKSGVEFVSYKIMNDEKPANSQVDYIEGIRLDIGSDGSVRHESKPALRMFAPENGYGSVIVIDKDKEDEIGFLLPDFVESVSRIDTAEDLLSQSVLSKLFYEPEQSKRIPPKSPPPVTVEIAPVSKHRVDVWEVKAEGWTVPLKYKNELADNFSINFKMQKKSESESHGPAKIDNIQKVWSGINRVVEYFRPKPPYNENLVRVKAYEIRWTVVRTDGTEESGLVTPESNKLIQDKPYAIAFQVGQKSYLIQDDDGDGKYEKRRELFRSDE